MQYPSTVSGPARTRAWSIRWANGAGSCTVGSTRPGPFDRCWGKTAGLTIASPAPRRKASAPSSSAAICSARSAANGADDAWKGWWGDNPPYHAPTFILTHHARAPIVMEGGTTFHFVTDGIEAALAQAKAAAGDLDVKIGGGVSTVRQYLLAGAIDELHLAQSPVVLGRGESLFADIDLPGLGYRVTETVPTELATHIVLTR